MVFFPLRCHSPPTQSSLFLLQLFMGPLPFLPNPFCKHALLISIPSLWQSLLHEFLNVVLSLRPSLFFPFAVLPLVTHPIFKNWPTGNLLSLCTFSLFPLRFSPLPRSYPPLSPRTLISYSAQVPDSPSLFASLPLCPLSTFLSLSLEIPFPLVC